ncbi:MAG: ammonium transporter [Symploca sp. SIO1B1]|nr:ammonium transporter [Symploca sp. SIO1C2]NER98060.1 ammonium transporter [Symploca sp. SIO1B1]
MSKFWRSRLWLVLLFSVTILTVSSFKAVAQTGSSIDKTEALEIFVNSLWLVVAGALVFFMNAGFGLLEAGSCSRKSLINVLAKNAVVFCIATLAFWFLGFSIMFGDPINSSDNQRYTCPVDSTANVDIDSYFGPINRPFQLPFPTLEIANGEIVDNGGANPLGFPEQGFSCLKEMWPNRSFASIFFFQLVFAGTAATIVSGAVVERVKFWAFFPFSFFLVLLIYPLVGHWVWGPMGWLSQGNFRDFAGSTVVHSVGGTAALVGAWLLGPRWTRFGYEPYNEIEEYDDLDNIINYRVPDDFKKELAVPHNLGFLTLGGLILWLGWIGFNGGSTPQLSFVPHIVATTLVASATGGIVAIGISQSPNLNPSLGTFINGILGGLVAITASSAYVDLLDALCIGVISAVIVVVGEQIILPWLKIDDPVGAIPVHLGCGGWGTLAVSLASTDSLLYKIESSQGGLLGAVQIFWAQLWGWLVICGVTAVATFTLWLLIGWIIFWWKSILTEGKIKLKNQGTKLGLFQKLFLWGRYGIRAPIIDEYVGSYSFFSDPQRDERVKQLQDHRFRD